MQTPAHPPSHATLALGFTRDGATTRLTRREHFGPLRVQKALYPEGETICHAIIVHPPGGVVGGDQIHIAATAGPGTSILLTTPGAAKWYRANGHVSRQNVALNVAAGATLEWLPQETIFFNDAAVTLVHEVSLEDDAAYLGIEILCFGRTAAGESFDAGRIVQRSTIRRGGRLVWFEQGDITAGSRMSTSVLGLGNNTVCATMVAAGAGLNTALVDAIRTVFAQRSDPDAGSYGVTLLKGVLVVRYLGHASAHARALMIAAWQLVRPALTGHDAIVPRIWNT